MVETMRTNENQFFRKNYTRTETCEFFNYNFANFILIIYANFILFLN